jgi:hypothetical protein
MNSIIYKYELSENCRIPKSAKILTLAMQKGIPCIWAIVDTESKETEIKDIIQYGTGESLEPFKGEHKYIGTLQEDGGRFIWHVFELL